VKVISAIKSILLPSNAWSLDVDLRYLPVVRFLKRNVPEASLLEVGASSTGITPYVSSTVVGADATFPNPIAERLIPVVTRHPLPFRDTSFDVVVSLDTFEHIPRELRQDIITEMLRIARRWVIIGFPEGDAAEEHDAAMETYFTNQHGSPHPFFVEHREYKVPRLGELDAYVHNACDQLSKRVLVQREKNVNIRLRSLFMRLVWHRSKSLQRIYSVITAMSRWDRLFHFGTCYRSIYYIRLNERY
jgi:hypothetical protein